MLRQRILAGVILASLLTMLGVARSQAVEGLLRGSSFSKSAPGKSFGSVPVVHHIGFWSHNNDFNVTELQVEQRGAMRESQPEAKIYIGIKGSLKKGRRIKELYFREQLRDAGNGKRIVEVVIIPVIEAETSRASDADESEASATAEYTLHQFQWPDNDFVIICGRHAQDVQYRYP